LLAVGKKVHRLTLRNDLAEIAWMMAWTDRLVAPFGLSSDTVYALQLMPGGGDLQRRLPRIRAQQQA
jgi:hypothetical protein